MFKAIKKWINSYCWFNRHNWKAAGGGTTFTRYRCIDCGTTVRHYRGD